MMAGYSSVDCPENFLFCGICGSRFYADNSHQKGETLKPAHITVVVAAAAFAVLCSVGMAWAGSIFYLSFETVDCTGESGFLSVEMDRFYRVVPSDCTNPNQPGEKLRQVHIRADSGSGGFDVYTITEAEMQNIKQQIELNNMARRKMVEEGKTVILEK